MKGRKTVFVCSQCSAQHPKWMGKCAECNAWNSINEEVVSGAEGRSIGHAPAGRGTSAKLTPLPQVENRTETRFFTGVGELDRVLGGGVVPGSLMLLSGDPGIGKSTLLLQALLGLANRGYKVLCASGEESGHQIKMRAERLGALHPNILITNETDLQMIVEATQIAKPQVLVIDSIQTVFNPEVPSSPGSVSQVRECTGLLLNLAKGRNISTMIIGHVTKEGNVAGPRVLEHLVDTVMYLEGDTSSGYRILRAIKNRFGSTGEIGVFAMHGSGLAEVPNPSALFLEGHRSGVEGSAVAISMEGSRPVLVEIQSLVGKTTFATPRRLVTGLDPNRFAILVAVLEKRVGLYLSNNDIYANVAGGLKLTEPAIDLAIAAAVTSSLMERPLAGRFAYFGEVGLSGEIRVANHALSRIQEAMKMGFDRVYLPARNFQMERERIQEVLARGESDMQLFPVENIREVVAPDTEGG